MFGLPATKPASPDYLTVSDKVFTLVEKRAGGLGLLTGGLKTAIDETKLRKLIDIAVTYRARLAAHKRADSVERYERWCHIIDAQPGTTCDGDFTHSYWRNKNLFVCRVSRKERGAIVPETTEIACLLSDGVRMLLTIGEKEQMARFDVIAGNGQGGYCLDGLDYDLALSKVFSLLSQVEGA